MSSINGTYRAILGNEVVKAGSVERCFEEPQGYISHLENLLNNPNFIEGMEQGTATLEILTGESVGDFEELGAGSEFAHVLLHYQDGGTATKEYDLHVYITIETSL